MPAVGSERQRIGRRHRIDRKRPIKMGEKLTAARRFPLQRVAEQACRHTQQHKAGLAGPVLGRAFHDLGSCREMDEAIGGILRGAGIAAGEFGGCPLFLPAHMMDDGVADHGRDTSGNRPGVKGRDNLGDKHAAIRCNGNFLQNARSKLPTHRQFANTFEKRICPPGYRPRQPVSDPEVFKPISG